MLQKASEHGAPGDLVCSLLLSGTSPHRRSSLNSFLSLFRMSNLDSLLAAGDQKQNYRTLDGEVIISTSRSHSLLAYKMRPFTNQAPELSSTTSALELTIYPTPDYVEQVSSIPLCLWVCNNRHNSPNKSLLILAGHTTPMPPSPNAKMPILRPETETEFTSPCSSDTSRISS